MKRVMIILCVAMFALWGCKGKTTKQDLENTDTNNNPKRTSGYVILHSPAGFSYYGYGFDNKTEPWNEFTTVEPIVNIEGRCMGKHSNTDFINRENNFVVKKDMSLPETKLNCNIMGMELIEGENLIEAVVDGNKNLIGTERIIVIYNPTVDFASSLKFSDDTMAEDEPVDVDVSILIGSLNVPDLGSVRLLRKESGQWVYVTTLTDSGVKDNSTNANTVYSGKFNTKGLKENRYTLRVEATSKGKANYSAPIYLWILSPNLTEKIKANTKSADEIVKKYFNESINEGSSLDEIIKYRTKVAEEIINTPGLVSAKVSEDGALHLVFEHLRFIIFFENGHESSINYELYNTDNRLLSDSMPLTDDKEISVHYSEFINNPILKSYSWGNEHMPIIQSNNVIYLSPFMFEFTMDDSYYQIFPTLSANKDPVFNNVSYKNWDVTVESFKNLHNYGIIIIDSHGSFAGGSHYILTGQKVDDEFTKKYKDDLDKQILTIGRSYTSVDAPYYYVVSSKFINIYSQDFPNSFVYLSACDSMKDESPGSDEMELVLSNKKAGAVLGYDKTVRPAYSAQIGKKLFEHLVDSETLKEALDKSKKEVGWVTDLMNFSQLVLKGNPDLKIVDNGLKNGGFEEMEEIRNADNIECQVLKGWTFIGRESPCMTSISVDNKLGPHDYDYSPLIEGQKIVVMVTDFGTSFYQKFKLPTDAKTISLSYKYLSRYLFGFSGREFCYKKDFRVTLADTAGNVINILSHDFSDILSFNVDRATYRVVSQGIAVSV